MFYVFFCVILFLCFSVLLALRLPRLGKRELNLVLFVRLFDLCLFGFVGFLFVSGKGCVISFRFDALTELGAFMRTEFLCVSVLRVASGPRVKLASCKSALNPPVVYSTDRSKAVVPVFVLVFVALWFILRGDLLYVFPCVILFLCFIVLLVLRLPRLGKRELILVLFVRLFDLCLFGFVGFLFLLGSGKGCGL